MFVGELNDALPHPQDLRAGQRRRDVEEQLREFLTEFGARQDIAHLVIVRRDRCREGRLGKLRGRRNRTNLGAGFVSGEMYVERFPSAVARHNLESDLHPWSKHARIAAEYGRVQENVFAAILRRDKSVTACLVELQNSSRSQLYLPQLPGPRDRYRDKSVVTATVPLWPLP
jgi:hypothetical protein